MNEEAIVTLQKMKSYIATQEELDHINMAIKALKERSQGKWFDESKDSLLCSACGKRVYKPFIGGFPTERTSHYYPNFCAFCGADMRGSKGNE